MVEVKDDLFSEALMIMESDRAVLERELKKCLSMIEGLEAQFIMAYGKLENGSETDYIRQLRRSIRSVEKEAFDIQGKLVDIDHPWYEYLGKIGKG